MLTTAELLALPYAGTSAFARGITADDYKGIYGDHAYRVRWWKGIKLPDGASGPNGEVRQPNGRVYIEQTEALNGTPLEDVRVYYYQTSRDAIVEDWGLIEKGATGMSCLPDEIEASSGDRFAFPDVSFLAHYTVSRGATDTDELPRAPVSMIVSVLFENEYAASSDYEATDTGIRWLSNAPGTGAKYSVEFKYLPVWEWRHESQGVMQIGADGKKLPQRGIIRIMQPTGDHPTL